MKNKRGKENKISTGSINFRITASAWAGMLVSFAIIDIAFAVVIMWDELTNMTNGGIKPAELFQTVREQLFQPEFLVIFGIEAVLLILKIFLGSKSVKHKLAPMERISNMAMDLGSGEGAFDEDKVHALEEAIDNISPSSDDPGLNTGDKELVGLEMAVNGLIKRMRESYNQQARFVSDASHELRTPIAVIKGYTDILDRWGKSDQKVLEESIDAIKTESDHMSYLVEQLLFLARGDSGKTKLKISRFNLYDVINEVYEESVMIDQKHDYSMNGTNPVEISGDMSLIKQTARILVDNAAKYTPEGDTIKLKVSENAKEVSFSVQDNGIGISEENLPHLFERFYRADDSRTRDTGGTGLGLAIAKWIVDRHNGKFSIVSREGIGTKITVIFPKR